MSPLQMELHTAHKVRVARMGGAAINAAPLIRARLPAPKKPEPPIVLPFHIAVPKPEPKSKPGFWVEAMPDDLPQAIRLKDIEGPILIEHVQRFVASYFEVRRTDLISSRRSHHMVVPRQIGMYLCRTVMKESLPEIGRRFGGRDHTTIRHAFFKMGERAQANDLLGCAIRHLEARLREALNAQTAARAA